MTQVAPIVLIIFNRPETTARVFESIRAARPTRLFIVADGPRSYAPGDKDKCCSTRQIVAQIDWPCEVKRLYSDVNLGCGLRPSTGISWVFQHVDEAIILEDDCLPDPSFFLYCSELLEHYRNEPRVMHIAGNNRGFAQRPGSASYYFSLVTYCWGWATWKRAWQYFDFNMSRWPEVASNRTLGKLLPTNSTVCFWSKRFADLYQTKDKDIWDFQWSLACWVEGGLAAVPNVNLVKNIGFGEGATHTLVVEPKLINLSSQCMPFPLIHPSSIIQDQLVDRRAFREFQRGRLVLFLERIKTFWE
jgi:hypothetical protein